MRPAATRVDASRSRGAGGGALRGFRRRDGGAAYWVGGSIRSLPQGPSLLDRRQKIGDSSSTRTDRTLSWVVCVWPRRGYLVRDLSLRCAAVEDLWMKSRGRKRPNGAVDYRFARQNVLRQFTAGELSRADVCDAQPELLRVAVHCSDAAKSPCPVCRADKLRVVRYVFGPRLPKSGRCVTGTRELVRLAQRSGTHRCYELEVCVNCAWNHLIRSFQLAEDAAPQG